MKKLLLSILLVSNLSFGQEAAYSIQGIIISNYDNFLPEENGIYYVNHHTNEETFNSEYSISYLPKNGTLGWKKSLTLPSDFYAGKLAIASCNLSNHYIVSIQPTDCSKGMVLKMDPDGNIIWSKIINYLPSMGDYGSNNTPISINDQDEITISMTSINNLTLSKFDTNGNLIFSKRFNSLGFEDSKNPGFSIINTNDGGYLLTMKAGDNPTITKLNSSLQVIWSKKWSIDSYSHPKLAVVIPNGNYCIIGEGDNNTYFAQVDPNGNLLSYKYGVAMSPPYRCQIIGTDSIKLVDMTGTIFKINLSNNDILLTSKNEWGYGLPNYTNQQINLLDYNTSMIYLDLESTQMGCFNYHIENHTLTDLVVYPSSVVDETIVFENSGSISNYFPSITGSNDVSMILTCNSNLEIEETNKTNLSLYPNPAAKRLKINLVLEKPAAAKLQILTLSGKVTEVYDLNGSVFTAPQEAGIYFVQLLDNSGNVIAVEKLIVE